MKDLGIYYQSSKNQLVKIYRKIGRENKVKAAIVSDYHKFISLETYQIKRGTMLTKVIIDGDVIFKEAIDETSEFLLNTISESNFTGISEDGTILIGKNQSIIISDSIVGITNKKPKPSKIREFKESDRNTSIYKLIKFIDKVNGI